MDKNYLDTHEPLIRVCIFSDANFLATSILENLLSKKCLVEIFTDDTSSWKAQTSHITNGKFNVLSFKDFPTKNLYTYAIHISGFVNFRDSHSSIDKFIKIFAKGNRKSLILLPLELYDPKIADNILVSDNVGLVYLGDVFGPRMDLDGGLFINRKFNEILYDRKISAPMGERLHPVFVGDVTRTITKWLFSFGPYGKETFLLGQEIGVDFFWKENKKIISELIVDYDIDARPRVLPRGKEFTYLDSKLHFALVETYKWFNMFFKSEPPEKPSLKTQKKPFQKGERHYKQRKYSKWGLLFVFLIMIVPLITLTVSIGALYVSYNYTTKGNYNKTENLLNLAENGFGFTQKYSKIFAQIPVVGSPYKEVEFLSAIGGRVSGLGIKVLPVLDSSSAVFEKILGNEIYDPESVAKDVSSHIAYMYGEVVLIQSEIRAGVDKGLYVAEKLNSQVDIDRIKRVLSEGGVVADSLPKILGADEKKSYLVLFLNNMEIRPAGGFIGSYGVMNFEGGRMTELTVNDVYSADGQLKGYVEPPEPIVKYLGEANWYLRDSNWDPDFETSAQRAEWFLDKTVDQKVDGVISVDLEVVREILRLTGPVFLADYNLTLSHENLYEKTQEEVHADFFPGSRKKASFLTALSRNLLNEVDRLNRNEKIGVLRIFFNSLDERHVQIYLHDPEPQSAIRQLGWSGSIRQPSCGDGCYTDFVGLVEANLGVNKANYFIDRTVKLNVEINRLGIYRTLSVNFSNRANPAIGPSGKYKVYIRLLVPEDATPISAISSVGVSEEFLTQEITQLKGRKEVGVLVDVLSAQEKTIHFNWMTPAENLDDFEKYGLYIRKQAGVSDDAWTVNTKIDAGPVVASLPFSLTKDGVYTYNTVLERDLVSLFSWEGF